MEDVLFKNPLMNQEKPRQQIVPNQFILQQILTYSHEYNREK